MADTVATAQEYKNDEVSFTMERKPGCIIEVHVKASAVITAPAKKKALKEVRKQASLPGFKKGSAPVDIVEAKYADEVNRAFQDEIANATSAACQKLKPFAMVQGNNRISYNMKNHSEESAELTLSFEAEPEVPSIDPKSITLTEVERPEVTKEKVQETLRQTQMFFAEWNEVTDHPVKEGDFILIDLDAIDNDPPTRVFTNTRFEVADKSIAQWLKQLVVGKKAGDVAEGVSKPDDDLSDEKKAEFEEKKVRVTINKVESCKLPELDDTFAERLGVKTVKEAEAQIEKLLNRKADEYVQEHYRDQLTMHLVDKEKLDLPQSLIHKEAKFRLEQLMKDQSYLDHWRTLSDEDKKKTVDSLLAQSEKAISLFYTSQKIVSDANVNVKPDEVEKAPANFLETLIHPAHNVSGFQKNEAHYAEAYSRLLMNKAHDHLIANANIVKAKKKEKEEKKSD